MITNRDKMLKNVHKLTSFITNPYTPSRKRVSRDNVNIFCQTLNSVCVLYSMFRVLFVQQNNRIVYTSHCNLGL